MTNRTEQVIDELVGRQPVGVALDLLDDHLRRGDAVFVADFGAALLRRYGAGGGEHRLLFERLLWRLATTPGRENVGHAVRLGLAALGSGRTAERRAAAVLAEYQPARHLGPVFAPGPADADLADPEHLTVFTTTPAEAWRALFTAASFGGGHDNYWWYSAYGRLAAWRSLAALVGAPDGAQPSEVERWAAACTWYGFTASTDWFNYADMDIGLLAFSPDGRRLAVLAATDYNGG